MLFDTLLQPFLDRHPAAVMTRACLERAFASEALDQLFRDTATVQRQKTILFSRLVELLGAVVTRRHASVHAAYRADPDRLGAALSSVYDKLNHTEPALAEALLGHTAAKLRAVTADWPGQPQPVAGLRMVVLDGTYFAGTEHRLEPLRRLGVAALPGMAVVAQDHATGLVTHLLGELDAYVNERALAERVLGTVGPGELVVADRNFCFTQLLNGVAERRSCFIVRHHRGTKCEELGPRRRAGRTDTGTVHEQQVRVGGRRLRMVAVELDRPTASGDTEIRLLTNLSCRQARATAVARTYRLRWRLEATFLELTQSVQGELPGLGYPQAALLAFALALCACNALRVVQRALELAQEEPVPPVPARPKPAATAKTAARRKPMAISTYYIVNELNAVWAGMDIVAAPVNWSWARDANPAALSGWLLRQARRADPRRYAKTTRGPKKKVPKKVSGSRRDTHRSTYRLLVEKKSSHQSPARP